MKLKWKNKATKHRGNLNHNEIADALAKAEVVEQKIMEDKVEWDFKVEYHVPIYRVMATYRW